jgi:hypothetical protein
MTKYFQALKQEQVVNQSQWVLYAGRTSNDLLV